jgi:hypothetical protein
MMGWNTADPSANASLSVSLPPRARLRIIWITLGTIISVLAEVMVFDRNAYAVVVEKSTGMGAMELLVDPSTLAVFPEYGPQHMWNAKYGMMGGRAFSFSGARTCGMGFNFNAAVSPAAQTALTMDEAAQSASQYLDENFQNAELDPLGQPFYGYFTFDYSVDGQTAGMVSVNSANGQFGRTPGMVSSSKNGKPETANKRSVRFIL